VNTSSATSVRPATPSDEEALAQLLSHAFEQDPFVRWFVRSDEKRVRASRRYFEVVLRRMIPFGHVYTTPDLRGAAVWSPPGRWEMGAAEQLKLLPDMLFVVGPERLMRVSSALLALEGRRPADAYHFLALIGTDPSARRRGIGRALMEPVLARCRSGQAQALLDTYSDENRRWYEGMGFRVVSEILLAGGGPSGWTMELG
jgi:ribosomal protein S18 acetylase RimI-like enzyme